MQEEEEGKKKAILTCVLDELHVKYRDCDVFRNTAFMWQVEIWFNGEVPGK